MTDLARLLADIADFLAAEQVTAQQFGKVVCGDPDMVAKLRRRDSLPPDAEIAVRVVMTDWPAYDGERARQKRERQQRWRQMTGERSKRDAVARRLDLSPRRIAEEALIPLAYAQDVRNQLLWGGR